MQCKRGGKADVNLQIKDGDVLFRLPEYGRILFELKQQLFRLCGRILQRMFFKMIL